MGNPKRKIVSYLGAGPLIGGSIRYYNGECWVFLAPGDDGDRLVTHGTGSAPSWEGSLLLTNWDSVETWDQPGFGWGI